MIHCANLTALGAPSPGDFPWSRPNKLDARTFDIKGPRDVVPRERLDKE